MKKERIIWKSSLSSTNQVLMENQSEYPNGTILSASEQVSGSGLGHNKWISAPGANLTFSYLLKPEKKVEASRQHLINMAVALALQEFLSTHTEKKVFIKWPNDLLIENQKICGILIQHILWGNLINSSVIGIGLNINQRTFPEFSPRATSLKLLTNRSYDLHHLLEELINVMDGKFRCLSESKTKGLKTAFLDNLYRYKEWARYRIRGTEKTARIEGISELGFLQLRDKEGQTFVCDLKEVEYLY